MGTALRGFIHGFAPWVAFVVLAIIGGKMIWEGWRGGDDDAARPANPFAVGTVLLLAVATSIDALAVGVSLSLLDVDLAWSVTVIGTVTFALSFAAMYAGRLVGSMLSGRLDILGGLILVGIGVKILVEHLLA
jgi:putative Mn2+ efflux pump MntP